ncbi:Flagellin protein FlaA [Hyphomicrobiales bacterium]|nr:Flagellin protein FlaA [Hyphomicrobiales bacterium]CAH1700137.1 Flagellin protein FlaA [Hyphomicrobiales bacterium]CAI0343899.1 Flagellin [Hyphomicrobiales bacterium]
MAVTLSAGVRASLSAISQASANAQTAQLRLATGKKVNSALDNATNYFTSEGLKGRASDLNTLLDSMGQGIKVAEAASKGIDGITKLVQTAKGLANAAKQTSDTTARAAYAAQYDDIRQQITDMAADSGYNGTNLIKATADDLSVKFSEADSARELTIDGVDLDSAGLALTAAAGSWATDANIDTDLGLVSTALTKLRTTAASFGANVTILQARQDFTKSMIDTLNNGADALVLADSNEEGANLLAAQTRGQLAQTALSLASQADQAVLRLF